MAQSQCLDNQSVRMMEVWIIEVGLYMGIIDIILQLLQRSSNIAEKCFIIIFFLILLIISEILLRQLELYELLPMIFYHVQNRQIYSRRQYNVNVPFSYNDLFTERKQAFRTPFYGTEIRMSCSVLRNATNESKTQTV